MVSIKLRSVAVGLGALMLGACAYSPPEQEPPTASPMETESRAASPRGEVQLAWEKPDQRLSGSHLEEGDIAAYRIYYGEQPEDYDDVVEVTPDQPLLHTVQGLEPGKRYYFAITAVDSQGRESPRSTPLALTAEAPSEEAEQTHASVE